MRNKNKDIKYFLIVSLFLLISTQAVFAQNEYQDFALSLVPIEQLGYTGLTALNILNLPLGGEQQGFAGAYTALARDISYLEANPAGASLQRSTEISLFSSNIISDVNLAAAAYTQRFDDLGIGAFFKLLHTPFEAIGIRGEQLASSNYTESVLGLNVSYTLLRSYYFDGLSLGANIKFGFRDIPKEIYERINGLNGQDQSSAAFMVDFGILTRFNLLKPYTSREKNFSVGLVLQNFGPPVIDDPLPSAFRVGLSYQPLRFWVVTADLRVPINLVAPGLSENPGFGFGTSLQFTDFLAVNAGFYAKAGGPQIAFGTDVDIAGFNLILNYMLDLSTNFTIPDHLSVQIKFNFGDSGRAELSKKVDNLYIGALTLLADARYEDVIAVCKQILDLDRYFSPAQETLELAQRSVKLRDQLENIQFGNFDQ